jgi:hypothetical protein
MITDRCIYKLKASFGYRNPIRKYLYKEMYDKKSVEFTEHNGWFSSLFRIKGPKQELERVKKNIDDWYKNNK